MYLDTAIVVKLLAKEPDSTHWAGLVDGQVLWSSEIMLTECFSALLRKEREGLLSATQRRRAWKSMEQDVSARRFSLVPLTRDILSAANTVLAACHRLVPLRSLDAIHIASAQRGQSWPLVTNDARMRQAATHLALPLAPIPER